MTQPDQRRAIRYEVQLPCRVYSPGSVFRDLSGLTVNMSRSGLLLAVNPADPPTHLPQVGQAARIVLDLPHLASKQHSVECHGRVVRVPEQDRGLRLAFEFRRYQFV